MFFTAETVKKELWNGCITPKVRVVSRHAGQPKSVLNRMFKERAESILAIKAMDGYETILIK